MIPELQNQSIGPVEGHFSGVAEPSVTLSRHDQHNLEIKLSLQFQPILSRSQVDLYLFMPRTVYLMDWDRRELYGDIHSRLRLSVQQNTSRHEAQLNAVREKLAQLLSAYGERLGSDALLLDEILNETRKLGAVLGDLLRFETRRLRKELLMSASRSNLTPRPELILADAEEGIEQICQILVSVESLIERQEVKEIPVLKLLRQYLHHLYSDFLLNLRQEVEALAAPGATRGLSLVWQRILDRLIDLQSDEANRYRKFSAQNALPSSGVDHELHLLRMSQIKKFFQAHMFIEVARKDMIRRFSEPAAAGAAAFAAMWAAFFEYLSQPSMHSVGFGGLFIICSGVALYVLKDRLKDVFRNLFTQKLSNLLPLHEQTLTAEGRAIGKIKEWFHLRRRSELADPVCHIRRRADLTEVECHLPEDVLHHRQEYELSPSSNIYGQFERSIQQIMRLNVERHLKHLDDPYKTIRVLGGDGELKQIRSHRVYHFYACIQLRSMPIVRWWRRLRGGQFGEPSGDQWYLYRIVVDKNGIERVEAV